MPPISFFSKLRFHGRIILHGRVADLSSAVALADPIRTAALFLARMDMAKNVNGAIFST
jgi:hypothetical protein